MIIKIGKNAVEYTQNKEFQDLVTSLKANGIDTRPELEVFYSHLDTQTQAECSRIVLNQMHDMYGDLTAIKLDTLWDLFLNFM